MLSRTHVIIFVRFRKIVIEVTSERMIEPAFAFDKKAIGFRPTGPPHIVRESSGKEKPPESLNKTTLIINQLFLLKKTSKSFP